MATRELIILIADNDVDDHFFISSALFQANCNVEIKSVYDGQEVLDLLYGNGKYKKNRYKPDAIILDLVMPKMDGLETLKKIKDNPIFKKIPIFVVSSTQTQDQVRLAMHLGAENFFIKPNRLEDYAALAKEIFNRVNLWMIALFIFSFPNFIF